MEMLIAENEHLKRLIQERDARTSSVNTAEERLGETLARRVSSPCHQRISGVPTMRDKSVSCAVFREELDALRAEKDEAKVNML